jgi:hypothetical protein
MADPNFQFDPPTGHNDTTEFLTNPPKEAVRGYMQRLHDQTRDFINNTLMAWIKETFLTPTGDFRGTINGGDVTLTEPGLSGAFNAHKADIVLIDTDVVADINAKLLDAATNNKWVRWIKDTYEIDSSIVIPSNSIIYWRHSTIKRKAGSGAFDLIKNLDAVLGDSSILMYNLNIDGNATIDGLTNIDENRFSGLKLDNVTDSELYNITVTDTINSEEQAPTPAAGIYIVNCSRIKGYNLNAYDIDGAGIFEHNSDHIDIEDSYTHHCLGSGIGSNTIEFCNFKRLHSHDNGNSNISINGPDCTVDTVDTYNSGMAGLNIGHVGYPADGCIARNIFSRDNQYGGIVVGGSADVQLLGVDVSGNGLTAGWENIRIFDGSTRCTIIGMKNRNSAGTGSGMRIYSGTGHYIDDAEISGNKGHGIYADIGTSGRIGGAVKCFNNNQSLGTCAGILLSQAIGWVIDSTECYDDQAVKTQTYGLWISGGSGHTIYAPNLHDNVTADYYASSSPTNIIRTYIPTEKATPTAINGWTLSSVTYYKDTFGIVHIEGYVNGGAPGNACFQLPVGFRPSVTIAQPTVAGGTPAYAYATVSSGGNITPNISGVNHYLDSISFKAVV